ncbi:carboxypeptidase regulatory-like domain-containing protein [Variovorax sp. PAMC26660]|uniref:carboxypeptidase regulatory-like domain-containing protein n=1 Tax=Variovorax sp. PAMC26660 TaxID=2762322 RepID=UPI00164DD110|nr:carboxypeptidase regulatory-like domain-containing protein [Variovorax sp. PAMC26660]QNK71259.1 carboxypeptidase regulatory-like domain-containing protein [Variovorax sp. PAMC26660]
MRSQLLRLSLVAGLCISVAACGGGGGGGGGLPLGLGGSPTPTSPASTSLSGTAATGAAFGGATVTVQDQSGATVCTTQTDGQGTYNCVLSPATKPPLAVTAVRDDQSLYSTVASSGGTANITPLTTVIVSRLSPDGRPANLAAAIQADAGTVTDARLQQQTAALAAALKSVLDALGQASFDPISGKFSADGTGHDKVLDALLVSVRPDSSAANIEITVKGLPSGDGASPTSVIFRSSDASVPALPTSITADQLASLPPPTLLADLFNRLNACYRLPLSQRVTAPNDATAVTGGPADVTAPACRELFVGNDPAGYINSGFGVGRDANNQGGFSTLFRPENTGRTWDRANFEFFRPNGDLTLSYRATDVGDNVVFGTLTARKVGGTLKISGDGHVYASNVRPVFAYRDMINSPAFNSYTTGYGIPIRNRQENGAALFSKVIVTSPLNKVLTFIPQPGLSFLVVTRPDGTPELNNGINLRGIYENPSTPGSLASRESGIGLLDPQYTDQQISQLQDQSVWKFEFVHATSGVPNVIQYERTLSRAATIGEIRQQPLFDLTPAMRTQLVARTSADSGLVYPANSVNQPNILDISATGNQDAWVVPRGALAPSVLTAYGFAKSSTRFNDSVALSTTARKAMIDCSAETLGDTHCDSNAGKQYAEGTRVHYLAFEAYNARSLGITRYVLFYKQF